LNQETPLEKNWINVYGTLNSITLRNSGFREEELARKAMDHISDYKNAEDFRASACGEIRELEISDIKQIVEDELEHVEKATESGDILDITYLCLDDLESEMEDLSKRRHVYQKAVRSISNKMEYTLR